MDTVKGAFHLHTHTTRCHHAEGEDRAYVEASIRAGYRVIGFSDHAPMLFPRESGYDSNFRMSPREAEGYVTSLLDLRREYAGDITIKIGFELEYYPALFARTLRFLCGFPIDYLIQGQHFLGNEYEADAVYSGRPTEDAAVLRHYVEQTVAGMASGAYTYLAHPDLCNFVGDREIYRAQMRRLCTSAKQLGCPLEVNFLGFTQHRCYPNEAFWQIAKEVGNDVVIGLDAHSPDAVLNQTALREMRAWISAQGLTPLSEISLRDPHDCEKGSAFR